MSKTQELSCENGTKTLVGTTAPKVLPDDPAQRQNLRVPACTLGVVSLEL